MFFCSRTEPIAPLPATSPYFTTSESKAKLLARFQTDVDNLPLKDSSELNKKKVSRHLILIIIDNDNFNGSLH